MCVVVELRSCVCCIVEDVLLVVFVCFCEYV